MKTPQQKIFVVATSSAQNTAAGNRSIIDALQSYLHQYTAARLWWLEISGDKDKEGRLPRTDPTHVAPGLLQERVRLKDLENEKVHAFALLIDDDPEDDLITKLKPWLARYRERLIPPVLVLTTRRIEDVLLRAFLLKEGAAYASHPTAEPPPLSLPIVPIRIPRGTPDLLKAVKQLLKPYPRGLLGASPRESLENDPFCKDIPWDIVVIDDEVDLFRATASDVVRKERSGLVGILKESLQSQESQSTFPDLDLNLDPEQAVAEPPWGYRIDVRSKDHQQIRIRFHLWGTDFALALIGGDREALDEVRNPNVDLFLIDIYFGNYRPLDRLGIDVIEIVRRHRKDVPVFALSAYGESELIEQAIGRGAGAYLKKPEPNSTQTSSSTSRSGYGKWPTLERLHEALRNAYVPIEPVRLPRLDITDRTGKFWEGWRMEDERERVRQILAEMFRDYDRIEVIRIVSEGLSPSRTFFVRPIRKSGDVEIEYNPRLVKIGPQFELSYEGENYRKVIDGYIDTFIGMVVRDSYARRGDLAGIMYTSVGASRHYIGPAPEYPQTLQRFIETCLEAKNDRIWEDVISCFDGIYEKILHGLYRNRQVKTEERILPYYSDVLPAVVSLEWRDSTPSNPEIVDLEEKEEKEETVFMRAEGYRRTLWRLNTGVPVIVRNGLLEELQESGGGRIRLIGPCSRLKIDIQHPPQEWLHDPRMRRRKIIPEVRGEVKKTIASYLTERICQRIETPLGLKCEALRKQAGLPDPVEFVQRVFHYNYRCRLTISTIHGDLNLANLLIAGRKPAFDYWMVDFAKTRENGPTAFDFVKLDTELRTQVLAPVLYRKASETMARGGNRQDVYRCLVEAYLAWERQIGPSTDPDSTQYRNISVSRRAEEFLNDPRVEALFRIACYVRGKAMAVLEVEEGRLEERPALEPEEYLVGLILYSLSALKFENLVDPRRNPAAPLPALIAYLCSAVYCDRLRTLVPYKCQP